jgi:hypothetical protein
MLKYTNRPLAVAALAVALGAMAAPCVAADYATTTWGRNKMIWFADATTRLPNNRVDIHIVRMVKEAQTVKGTPVHFVDQHYLFICARKTQQSLQVISLDDDGKVVEMANLANMGLAAEADAKTPTLEILKTVCDAKGVSWTHSDDNDWTVVKQTLAAWQAAP